MSSNSTEINNAIIKDTMLGYEDHGILTFMLFVETSGYQCGVGGYVLDNYDKEQKRRIPVAKSMEAITKILNVVGVKRWEDLKGQYIRIKSAAGWSAKIKEIGNIMTDKWFNMEDFFSNMED